MSDPIRPELRETMTGIGRTLGAACPPGFGFALLMFDMNTPRGGFMNYISNAERESMLVAMKEFIANAEGRSPPTPETPQ